jgi:hypothetical protein
MPAARWAGRRYDVLNVTENAEWVLRDEHGDVHVGELDDVEVQCERCGRWSRSVAPTGTRRRWVCHDRECYDEERS